MRSRSLSEGPRKHEAISIASFVAIDAARVLHLLHHFDESPDFCCSLPRIK